MIEIPDIRSVRVSLGGQPVGTLALTADNLCAFQYDADYLRTGHSISPLKLPLTADLFIAGPQPFDGGFGVFDDSLPDGWGRLVQDRFLRSEGVDPDSLSVPARLALMGKGGRGALEYGSEPPLAGIADRACFGADAGMPDTEMPDTEMPDTDCADIGPADTDSIAADSERLYASSEIDGDDLFKLYRCGGSSGGARPKAFIRTEDGEWLVKFRASADAENIGEVEYRTSLLAARCGVAMPETRLMNGRYYAVRRFDRTGTGGIGKVHTASAAGLLDADYRIPSLDYSGLLKLCFVLTRSMAEVEQLYRRMVFNIAIRNRDDHARNFAFQMGADGVWRLAPAYDLVPSYGFAGNHTTTVNGNGRPTVEDAVAVALAAGLSRRKAGAIWDEVFEAAK